ncbi:MAG: GHKL domain-containing protein [Oscillospiraceae bacterium]|jgi:hypothetical protein|nr:GHKL domain-containing protein [Oscillospiraceae bacterium]
MILNNMKIKSGKSSVGCSIFVASKFSVSEQGEALSDESFNLVENIVTTKKQISNFKNIKFEITQNIRFPKINEVDFFIIFNNLLNVCIEICEKIKNVNNRFISVQYSENKNFFMYKIFCSKTKKFDLMCEQKSQKQKEKLLIAQKIINKHRGRIEIFCSLKVIFITFKFYT